MSESKHTPLPWMADGGEVRAESGNGRTVALLYSITNEDEANAALIVRAVNSHDDLVSALEIMIRAFNVSDVDPIVAFTSIERARAALKKAGAT